jgi:hypothetical protein
MELELERKIQRGGLGKKLQIIPDSFEHPGIGNDDSIQFNSIRFEKKILLYTFPF